MAQPKTQTSESEFRLALSTRQERDQDLDGYFFDSSAVFVYLNLNSPPISVLSNLVHELAHAKLASSPMGFLLYSLFEIAANTGEELYHLAVEPTLRKHLMRNSRRAELEHLQTVGPRDRSARRRSKDDADSLFRRAQHDLVGAFSKERVQELLAVFRCVERRRAILIQNASICQEAIATYHQLGENNLTIERYGKVARALLPQLGYPKDIVSPDDIIKFIVEKRTRLSGVWAQGFCLANRIARNNANPLAVDYACILSHHFPYDACKILDMPDPDFDYWASSVLLSANERFLALSELDGPIGKDALTEIIDDFDLCRLHPSASSFTDWHRKYVLESDLCQPLSGRLRTLAIENVADNWTTRPLLLALHPPPPILCSDGTIVASHNVEHDWLKVDFIRSQKMRTVSRILERLKQ